MSFQSEDIFVGQNGFYWWFGTVEDNGDPLGMGRCRIRITGWHNPDDNELPVETLPWAYPITPITNSAVGGVGVSPTGPQPGTRVIGFFIDGKSAQQPMFFGSVPGASEYEYKRKTPYGSTSWLPSLDEIVGKNTFNREGDCPPGYEDDTAQVTNERVPDQDKIKINKSEWCIPYSGFVSSAYNEARGTGSHNGVDICPAGFFPQTDPGRAGLNGILRGPTGRPVFAAAAGEVVYIWTADKGQGGASTTYDKNKRGSRSFGNAVAIRHTLSTGTYTTIYAHLGINQDAGKDFPGAGISVQKGQRVSKGQQIGTVGRSHVWDSPTHLHFEIRIGTGLPKSNNHINPGRIFPQLYSRHTSLTDFVRSSPKYNVSPPYKLSNMPVKELDPPKDV
jgi:murein DD-endopeptidase MepM/ murein hydrolase activator NlpD